MQRTMYAAGLSVLVFGLAGIAFFALVLVPVALGYEDTDDPALMLAFTRAYPKVFVQEGLALLTMSISLVVAVVAMAEVIGRAADVVALRSISVFGWFAALCFFVGGALRVQAAGPVVHIADLNAAWGESAYLAVQVGAQALLITALLMVGLWSLGVGVIGYRSGVLPGWLAALACLPALRAVLGTFGPLGLVPEIELLWLLGMVAIPGTMLWTVLLGVVLLRRGRRGATSSRSFDERLGEATR